MQQRIDSVNDSNRCETRRQRVCVCVCARPTKIAARKIMLPARKRRDTAITCTLWELSLVLTNCAGKLIADHNE